MVDDQARRDRANKQFVGHAVSKLMAGGGNGESPIALMLVSGPKPAGVGETYSCPETFLSGAANPKMAPHLTTQSSI